MSKIQDAIRKIQAAAGTKENADPNDGKKIHRIAEVVRGDVDTKNSWSTNHRIIKIDHGLLRESGLLAPIDQQHHIADQYRLIKRPLLENVAGRGAYTADDGNLIMVASALAGDGKTFNCINLALSRATEKDTSVLLVDADVGKPHISQLFGLENELGLIDALTDHSIIVGDLLLPTNVPGLSILPAGHQDEHATELLASRRMAKLVNDLSRSKADRVVIFDSPPLLVMSEARVLASLMGQIVLVVYAGHTPQHAVQEAANSLNQEKAISLLLNQSNQGFGAGGYSGYSGYGYNS